MRPPKYDLTTANPAGGVVPAFNPSAALGTAPANQAAFIHPFKIYPNDGGIFLVQDSILFDQIGTDSTIAITDLDSNWDIVDGQVMYLHGIIASGAISSVEILVSDPFNPEVQFSGDDQTDFYYRIGVADEVPTSQKNITGFKLNEDTWIYQRTFTHLRITSFCVNGVGALFPIPT